MPPAASIEIVSPARDAEHLYWVDWLRFLAALTVVLDHTRMLNWLACHTLDGFPHGPAMTAFIAATQLGREAVVVFFVLSGMLVGGRTLARVRQGTFDAAAYATDRLARIYVPLIPALLLTAAVVRLYDLPFHPAQFLGCLISAQGIYAATPPANPPLWTLPYEVWFYVLTGCAAAVCTRGAASGKRLAAGAGAVLALSMFRRLDLSFTLCWLIGVAGFWLRGRIKRRRGLMAVAGAIMAAAGAAAVQMNLGILPSPRALWLPPPAVALLVVAVGTLLFVACVVQMPPATRTGRWTERQGTRLAGFSYTLYLTHSPVLYLLAVPSADAPAVDGPSVGRACWWLAVCVAAAVGMHALFEARTPAVRRWLRARLTGGGDGRPRSESTRLPLPVMARGNSVPY